MQKVKVQRNRVLAWRGYDKHTGQMLDPNQMAALGVFLRADGAWMNIGDRIIPMQFASKQDVNNVPVFENDIIDCDIQTEFGWVRQRGFMSWDEMMNTFQLKLVNSSMLTQNQQVVAMNMLVVGNTFQHKELLKKEPTLPNHEQIQ